jgi:uncharacterized membrane-anchored protein YitT (DUF2179 family)
MIYVVYLALALITFLVVLNGFFRSAKKAQIDAVLCLLLIVLINIPFFIAGWKLGLIAIAIVYITAIISPPFAARLTSRLVALSSDSGGVYVGLPSRRLQKISQELGKLFDTNNVMEDIFSDGDRKTSAENALLDYCEQQPTIQVLLREHNISRQDLQLLYQQLLMAGAGQWTCGHWVAASALAYPESLRYMLTRKGENMQKTAFNLIMYFEKGTALET